MGFGTLMQQPRRDSTAHAGGSGGRSIGLSSGLRVCGCGVRDFPLTLNS